VTGCFLGDLDWRQRGEERPEQGTQKPFQPAQEEAEVDLMQGRLPKSCRRRHFLAQRVGRIEERDGKLYAT